MELCCEGALVMPKNYAVMDEEEMSYTEGGGPFGQLDVSVAHLTRLGAEIEALKYAYKPLETAGGKSYGLMRLAMEIRAHAMLSYGSILPSALVAGIKALTGYSNATINSTLEYIKTHSNPIDLGDDSATRVAIYTAMWSLGV